MLNAMFQACTIQTCVRLGSIFVIQSANCTISKYLPSCCKSCMRIQSALAISPRKPPKATVVNARTGGALEPRPVPRSKPSSGSARWRLRDFCTKETIKSRTAAHASNAALEARALIPSTRRLCRGQFAAGEGDHANGGEDASEEQDNSRERHAECLTSDAAPGAERIDWRKI